MKAGYWLLTLVLFAPASIAQDFFVNLDTSAQGPATSDSPFSYIAWVQQKAGYGYRSPSPGFSRDSAQLTQVESRFYGQLTWDWDAWQLRLAGALSHDWLPDLDDAGLWSGYELNNQQRQARRWRWREDDSYLAWRQDDWWIKAGYLTLAWGEAESLKVTDVLARRDQRWPGQEDLEQLRLPIPALVINWRQLELIYLADTPVDRQPAPLDEFDSLMPFRWHANHQQPEVSLRSQTANGWALRWQHAGPGLDLRLLLSDSYSPEPVLADAGMLIDEEQPRLDYLHLEQYRQQMIGLNLQTGRGSWLLKTEQAWLRKLRLQPANPLDEWEGYDQWRAMYALEYSGIRDLLLSGEFTSSYTPDHQASLASLASDKWQTGYGLRFTYKLFNDRLNLGGVGLRLNGDQGDVMRLSLNWQQNDRLNLGLTLVEYSADQPRQQLHLFRHNDSLLLSLRYGFN